MNEGEDGYRAWVAAYHAVMRELRQLLEEVAIADGLVGDEMLEYTMGFLAHFPVVIPGM